MSIYITDRTLCNPNINLSKFEPLKPSRSGDISLLVFKIFGPKNVWTKKYNVYSQNTHTSCVYFDLKFSGLSPIYPNVTLRSSKVVLKKWAKIGGYVPLILTPCEVGFVLLYLKD